MSEHTSPGEHPRVFKASEHDIYIDAGYHEQEWGPHPTADHEIIGTYRTSNGGTLTVAHLEACPSTGHPVFELTWNAQEDGTHGGKVTVLDAETALLYMIQCGAATVDQQSPRYTPGVANYTVINGNEADYSNINAGGVDVGALSYRDAVTLTTAELAILLDGTSFPSAAVMADQAAVLPVAAATQRKRVVSLASMYLNPLAQMFVAALLGFQSATLLGLAGTAVKLIHNNSR